MNEWSKLTRRVVYGFLRWFESFNSVWQTTLLCAGVGVFEIALPNADRHLIAVLLVSLYATFTQNGLAHGNKLTSGKVDETLAKLDEALETLLQLGRNDATDIDALVALTSAIHSVIAAMPDPPSA